MARAINADEYINFTDVDGVYSLSPKICESKTIKEISFDGVRQLGEFGTSVLHEDSVLPLVGTKTKIRLRNTFNEGASGTLIYGECKDEPFAVACKNGLNYFIAKKRGEGYELANRFAEKRLKVLFLCSDMDRFEVCFRGEFDCEEFSRQIVVDFYSDTREIVVYYIAESDEGKSLVANLLKEVDVKILSSVKSGYYLVVEDKNRERINEKIKEFQGKMKSEK
jgi:aspartokinase